MPEPRFSYKNDDDGDERANPYNTSAELSKLESASPKSESKDTDGAGNGDRTDSESINQKEQDGATNPMNYTGKGLTPGPAAVGGFSLKATLRKKGPLGVIIALLLGGGTLMLFPTMAPFAMLYNVTNDLNDHLAALDARQTHIFRGKVNAGAIAEDTVAGCRTLSVRCKLRSLSSAEVKRLERVGFKIEGRTVRVAPGITRTVPTSFTFHDVTYDNPRDFLQGLRDNTQMRNAHMRANNMKYIGYSSKSFMTNVLYRYRASKVPPRLTGSIDDRINQLLTAARTADFSGIRFSVIEGSDPERYHAIDRNGNTINDPEGNPRQFDKSTKDEMERRMNADSRPKFSSTPAGKITVGALSIVGTYDLACTAKNMIGAAAVGAKVAVYADTIRYAMSINSSIGKIQSGQGSPEDAEAVGRMITDPDMRKDIIDMTETVKAEIDSKGTADFDSEVLDVVTKENPYYNKSFLDASLINMSINGGYKAAAADMSASKFSFGGNTNNIVRGLGNVADVLDTLLNAGSNNAICNIVQNPITRGVGIFASVILGFTSLGTISAIQLAAIAAPVAAVLTLGLYLNSITDGSVIDDLAADPQDKAAQGNAYWAGNAALSSTAAQSYGMKPASAEEIGAFQSSRNDTLLAYQTMEAEEVDALDISDPRSHLGAIVNSFHKSIGPKPTAASLIGSIPRSLAQSVMPSALANTAEIDRFKQCKDEDLTDIGIDADIQCNVRYTMSSAEMSMDPLAVAQWMEDNGYVEKDTTTGLPAGYTPPSAEEAQNAALELIRGATVGQFFDRRASVLDGPGNRNYAYFLEYCAYRALPYGKTYEENLIGSAPEDWKTGEKCLENSTELSHFRVYTMDRATEEGLSEEGAIRSGSSNVIDQPDVVSGSDKELAQAILDNENITYVEQWDSGRQIRAYAEGDTSCYLHPDLLKLIASLGETHTFRISSLNRSCTGSEAGSGKTSLHWGGRALDIDMVNGKPATGKSADDIAIYNSAMRILPNSRLQMGQLSGYIPWNGQTVSCRPEGSLSVPPGNRSYELPDLCHHIHIGIDN